MPEWLIPVVAVYMLLLISFIAIRAALDHDDVRGQRAVRVLRMLLIVAAPGAVGALVKLHQAGLL